MRQIETMRKRFGSSGQWVQLGITAATVVTPLITRWQTLRTAERARTLRDEAEARLQDVRSRVPLPRQAIARQAAKTTRNTASELGGKRNKPVVGLWLAGVGVGLVAAGSGAYFLVRRRMAATIDEPLVDLPMAGLNGNSAHLRDVARQTVGVAAGQSTAAPQATTSTPTPEASAAATETERPMPETAMPEPQIEEPGALPNGSTLVEPDGSLAGVVDAEDAPFIGNIRTMIFHDADADNLPAEENRIYFASEAEARAAGYRHDRDEAAPGEESSSTSAGASTQANESES